MPRRGNGGRGHVSRVSRLFPRHHNPLNPAFAEIAPHPLIYQADFEAPVPPAVRAAKPVLEVIDECCGGDAVNALQRTVHKFCDPAATALNHNRVVRR
jgi:hypothetical protein